MKKIVCGIVALIILVTLLGGCFSYRGSDPTRLRILVLQGPSGMAMAPLMYNADERHDFALPFSSPQQVVDEILSGRFDIAALPANLAATLYNSGADVQIIAAGTLGVLHILDATGEVREPSDLTGRRIFTAEQGALPEHVLRHILNEKGIDAEIYFLTNFVEVSTHFAAELVDLVMLPAPNIVSTLAQMSNSENVTRLDVSALWNEISDTQLMQTAIVARRGLSDTAIREFLEEYKESIAFVNANHDLAANMIVEAGVMPSIGVARQAIPLSNLAFIEGASMQAGLMDLFNILHRANPQSIGGLVPPSTIFWNEK